ERGSGRHRADKARAYGVLLGTWLRHHLLYTKRGTRRQVPQALAPTTGCGSRLSLQLTRLWPCDSRSCSPPWHPPRASPPAPSAYASPPPPPCPAPSSSTAPRCAPGAPPPGRCG